VLILRAISTSAWESRVADFVPARDRHIGRGRHLGAAHAPGLRREHHDLTLENPVLEAQRRGCGNLKKPLFLAAPASTQPREMLLTVDSSGPTSMTARRPAVVPTGRGHHVVILTGPPADYQRLRSIKNVRNADHMKARAGHAGSAGADRLAVNCFVQLAGRGKLCGWFRRCSLEWYRRWRD
jgi:hypothetical protein